LAKQEGLFLDPVYSGKAFFGMLQRMKEGLIEEDDVVFVHTGGLFGLMAQSDGLARELSTSV
jgi:D-cysteine desulfhydrase